MNIQRNGLFFIFFLSIFLLSACSKVGDLVSNTGDFVSKTGEIIGGNNDKKEPAIKLEKPKLPTEIKVTVAKPASTTIQVKTTSRLSQSRINVSIVQLKSGGQFSSSRLSALESDTESALGSDFISKQSVSLKRGESKSLTFKIDPATKTIGAFASFNELNQTIWRTSVQLPKATDASYKILINVDNKLISAAKL